MMFHSFVHHVLFMSPNFFKHLSDDRLSARHQEYSRDKILALTEIVFHCGRETVNRTEQV